MSIGVIEPPDQWGAYKHHAFLTDRHPGQISRGYLRIRIKIPIAIRLIG